jgi:tRNA(fMet)-specific endonuclease VapC
LSPIPTLFRSSLRTTRSAKRYDPELAGRVALISFMTVAKVERWAIQYRWSEHRVHWLHSYLRRFTVVPSSPDLCRKWAEVMVAAQAVGRRIECAEAWIAATALLYDAPLVTHNRGDYLGVPGLNLVSHGDPPS